MNSHIIHNRYLCSLWTTRTCDSMQCLPGTVTSRTKMPKGKNVGKMRDKQKFTQIESDTCPARPEPTLPVRSAANFPRPNAPFLRYPLLANSYLSSPEPLPVVALAMHPRMSTGQVMDPASQFLVPERPRDPTTHRKQTESLSARNKSVTPARELRWWGQHGEKHRAS